MAEKTMILDKFWCKGIVTLTVALYVMLVTGSLEAQDKGESFLSDRISVPSINCASFTQKRFLADFDTAIYSSGIMLKDGDNIEWRTLKPIEDTTIIGPDANQVSPALSAMAPLLRSLLSGSWNELDGFFSIELSSVEGSWKATLLPRQAEVAERLERLLLKGETTVDRVELYFSNEDQLIIELQAVDCATIEPRR